MGRYIILTKSGMKKEICGKRFSGICVVAYNMETRGLERFVQAPEGGPLSGSWTRSFSVLDEVEVFPLRDAPEPPQTENRMILQRSVRSLGPAEMDIRSIALRYARSPGPRYMADASPFLTDVSGFDHSVEICRASGIRLIWPGNRKRPRASFRISSRQYLDFRVTDPAHELEENAPSPEPLTIPEAFLIVSIPSVPHTDGLFYKFIAAICPVEPLPEAAPAPPPPEKPAAPPRPSAGVSYREQVIAQGSTSAYAKWTPEEDEALRQAFKSGVSIRDLSLAHRRTRGAILSRLRKLSLID